MSSSKTKLRAINDLIKKQKFDEAAEEAKQFLEKESKNYQGHIFLAFAQDKRNDLEEAERVYLAATSLRPGDAQAWQGLVKLYEKVGTKKLGPYQHAVVNLARIFHEADELYKSQDVVDKYLDYVRVHGDKVQYADALWIQLPESPLYPLLEGRFPPPGQTYDRVAGILEEFEKKRINTLIGERRTRLGAKLSEVTLEVKREVYGQSKLEGIYRQLINWTRDDDIRRQYEEKLIHHCYERMLVQPPGETKDQERQKVFGLANDMVVINHPYKLAWEIAMNWQDKQEIKDFNVELLRGYCNFFPDTDLYKIITAFLTSTLSPFPEPEPENGRKSSIAKASEDSEDDDEGGVPTFVVPLTHVERLSMLVEGVSTLDSIFGYRLAGQLFVHFGEYESTVEFMRKAQDLLKKEQAALGCEFKNTRDSYLLSLGTALVYFQSPRHHAEAKALFEKVLDHDGTSTSALIGVGLIYEEEEEYDQAIDFFGRALERDPLNVRVKSESAWVKALKKEWEQAKAELQECLGILEDNPSKDLLADTQYRLGVCIWNLEPNQQERKRRKGDSAYSYWLSALNNNLNHAPSYTSLGIFYADYAKDKKRARRCFQKALEISPSEVVAAERLARSFAKDGDWDRVELVAQRIVDSGKVKPPPGSKRKGISWPFAALGVAELNKQDFHKAIVSFQAALRLSPNDYHSWVGLGESYHSSGRFIAATKAILNAQKLEEDSAVDISGDTWFTKYMLGNVRRELGDFDESIVLYQAVMETHPEEEGVKLALMQTMIDNALSSIEKGLFGKSAELATGTIEFAAKTGGTVLDTFNFWKSLGDACSVFVTVQNFAKDLPLESLKTLVDKISPEASATFAEIDKVSTKTLTDKASGETAAVLDVDLARCIQAMILCYKQAIHISALDRHAQAVGYYNLGWAEQRAHTCLPAESQRTATPYIKAAVRAFKRAIELEAGNWEFWNALGVVTGEINPAVSQHAFVRSLHLNERNPAAWTNLGTLALLSGDIKLANESFTRAQSTDPDYAHAWLGQGFLALMYGDKKEARGLFTHAMGIAEASSLPTRHHYSASMFDHILTAPPGLNVASLIQPLFALDQVQSLRPKDVTFGHLSTHFRERVRDSPRSVGLLEKICSLVEADYEKSESAESLARFIMTRTDLARAYLAAGSYEKAVECGDMALGLSSDDGDSELSGEQRKKARLSAHMTVGLAHYYADRFDDALKYFESALEESDGNPDAVCLLTQVLWAQGSEEARERAREALFEVIGERPDHVQSVLLLGVIALLDNDPDSLEAVTEALESLRTNDKVTPTQQSHIGEVLRAIATLAEDKSEQGTTTQAQTDIMLFPNLPHGWSALTEATGDEYTAQVALKVAQKGIPPRGTLECHDLTKAYAGTGLASDAQKAAFLAPWESEGWASLAIATQGI
ncbi:unnamed protein product [Clonostachys chloroleuca]|uniref:Superkiller protein 3 n=1 Tax=Clonostachys chloroleuca TaxID=1926264 RepID=A0AA35MBV8_9HYPO|nr:unnamed protein product [Clonostachys chloroleuca]